MIKTCTNCREEKRVEEFHKKKAGKYGHHSECKICLRLRVSKQKKKWDEVKKQHRRDLEKVRRSMIRSLAENVREEGGKSLNSNQFTIYEHYTSSFIKRKARLFLNSAVQNGWIVKADRCSECGLKGLIHGHHTDYSHPLLVIWLCPKCHAKYDKKDERYNRKKQRSQ